MTTYVIKEIGILDALGLAGTRIYTSNLHHAKIMASKEIGKHIDIELESATGRKLAVRINKKWTNVCDNPEIE